MMEISKLTKQYGDTVILQQADYTFPQRGILCLMGASGSGKTTLFNLLAGFDTDYQGTITVDGTPITGMTAEELCAYRRDNIGFVFQNYHLLPGYTALENVMLACDLSPDGGEENLQKAKGLLERLGLAEKAGQRVETLSGGQKQRVAIARALMGDPQFLFADEPTGALDRKTATEIMELLREIAADRLVIIVTHDAKICAFADEVIHIREQKIVSEGAAAPSAAPKKPLARGTAANPNMFARGAKNVRVHLGRYLAVSLATAIGLLAFLFSLSFGNVMEQAIRDFEQKNTALHSGFIKGADDGTRLAYLRTDERIETAYYQYKLGDITLTAEGKSEMMPEKLPGSKATERMSYGIMPRRGEHEVSITPSLAKKFAADIKSLIGKELTLTHNNISDTLTISGIFNAGYDDFFVSADIEQQLYAGMEGQEVYSITYEVTGFDQVAAVDRAIKLRGLEPKTAADEVEALQNTFDSLNKLFLVISVLVLAIGLFICGVLLFKLQNSRYHEVGLLSALGFGRRQIFTMIVAENSLLSALAAVVTLLLLGLCSLLAGVAGLPFTVTGGQILLTMAAAFAAVMTLSGAASCKLLRTEPAAALRK